jgi:hypothetical protein
MGHRLAAALLLAALLAVPSTASGATPTTWLCKPGASPNPCTSSLTTTERLADGSSRVVRTAVAGRKAKIDCFYVYPTVSSQPTDNANLKIDPEQTAIAQYQASRFSQHCRVFAPMYRQLTLAAIGKPDVSDRVREKAFFDVRDAWREYLRKHNKGRGVVLIGHSQGTYMLRELIKREIDDKPAVRRKLVSGLLIGGNVEVRKGADRGGDFDHVPLCRKGGQTGCVVAYSMYDETAGDDLRFARASSASRQIACTDPAKLAGTSRLDAYARTAPFPGTLGIAVNASLEPPITGVTTPWVAFPDRATARCVTRGRLSYLQVLGVPGDPRPTFKAKIGADWGLHLGDVNLALGQLTDIVRAQARAFTRR